MITHKDHRSNSIFYTVYTRIVILQHKVATEKPWKPCWPMTLPPSLPSSSLRPPSSFSLPPSPSPKAHPHPSSLPSASSPSYSDCVFQSAAYYLLYTWLSERNILLRHSYLLGAPGFIALASFVSSAAPGHSDFRRKLFINTHST